MSQDEKIRIATLSEEITLRRNARIKRLSIKLSSHSGIVVCVPMHITKNTAIDFVVQQKEWIHKHLAKAKYQKEDFPSNIQLVNQYITFVETEHNTWSITKEKDSRIIAIPNFLHFSEKEELKRKLFEKVLRDAANDFLPQRIKELAAMYGFSYSKLSLRNQKTRWGSCSYKNAISLNIQLMRFPMPIIDYVIIHELAHTIHKNHSAKFWQLVQTIIGEKELYLCKKELANQKIEL